VQTLGTREALLQALKAFLAAAMVMAVCSVLWALWMFVLHRAAEPFYKPEEGLRCESIAVDPLRVAAFLIFPMLLMAGLQQRARTRGERGWATALFWLGMVSCGLCVSRSAVLQILPGLFFFWLLTRRHLGKLVLLAAALAAMTLTFSLLLPRLVGIERYELGRWALLRGSDESLVESRVLIWRATWEAFSENPWLGVGLDNFRPRYYEFRDPWLARGWIYVQAKPPHSTYASVLVETGIVGLLGFVVLVAYFFFLGRITVLQARRDQDLARYLVAAAAFSAFAAHLIAGIALELLSHNHLWVIMAITTVIDTRRPGRGTATLGAASEAQRPGGQQLGSGTVAEAPY